MKESFYYYIRGIIKSNDGWPHFPIYHRKDLMQW